MKKKDPKKNTYKNIWLSRSRRKKDSEKKSEELNPEVVSAEDVEKQTQEKPPKDKPEITDEDIEKHLTHKQILFCKHYISNQEVLWNWTRSYAHAYWYYERLKWDPLWLRDWTLATCQASASRLLSNVMICRYIWYINKLVLNDDIVQKNLALLSLQKNNPSIQLKAIDLRAKINWKIVWKLQAEVGEKWAFGLTIVKKYDKDKEWKKKRWSPTKKTVRNKKTTTKKRTKKKPPTNKAS